MLPMRISSTLAGQRRLGPTLVQPIMPVIFNKAVFASGLRRSTLHHGFVWILVRANDFAAQAAFAFPSTAREDNPPERVDDCFVGLPLAILPADWTERSCKYNWLSQNQARSARNTKGIGFCSRVNPIMAKFDQMAIVFWQKRWCGMICLTKIFNSHLV